MEAIATGNENSSPQSKNQKNDIKTIFYLFF